MRLLIATLTLGFAPVLSGCVPVNQVPAVQGPDPAVAQRLCFYGDATSCRWVTSEQMVAYRAKRKSEESAMCASFPDSCSDPQAKIAFKAAEAKADEEAQAKWAKEQRLGAIALGMAREACKSVSADEIVSAYNAQHFAYLGHPITFKSAGGAVADPRNGWVGNGTGASSPYGATCSAFGQAETTDGTDLSVVAPLSFILSASGNSIAAVSIHP